VAAASLLAALPAASQTVLLLVRESVDSAALPTPFPVREGVSDSLFNAGVVVVEAPGGASIPAPADAARMARAAGADAVVELVTVYTDTQQGADVLRIAARTTWSVLEAVSGRLLGSGNEEATNRDRERDVDRMALGAEIGRKVADQVLPLLQRGGS